MEKSVITLFVFFSNETSAPIYTLTEEEYQSGKFEKWLNV